MSSVDEQVIKIAPLLASYLAAALVVAVPVGCCTLMLLDGDEPARSVPADNVLCAVSVEPVSSVHCAQHTCAIHAKPA